MDQVLSLKCCVFTIVSLVLSAVSCLIFQVQRVLMFSVWCPTLAVFLLLDFHLFRDQFGLGQTRQLPGFPRMKMVGMQLCRQFFTCKV